MYLRFASLAQWVEHRTVNPLVASSSLAGCVNDIFNHKLSWGLGSLDPKKKVRVGVCLPLYFVTKQEENALNQYVRVTPAMRGRELI